MKRIALLGLLIASPALADSDISKAGAMNRLLVDTTLTGKYCPGLEVDQAALTEELARIGSASAGVMLVEFMKLDQTKAFIILRTEAFKKHTALECEKSRLYVHLKNVVKQKGTR